MDSDIPVRPMPIRLPDAGPDAGVERRERTWTLMLGSRRLSFSRIEQRIAPRQALVPVAPPRRWSLTGAIAVVLGSAGAMATLALASNASRAATGDRYVLTIPVPGRVSLAASRPRAAAIPAIPRSALATVPASPATATVVAENPIPSDPMAADMIPVDAAPAAAVRPAIEAAVKTGMLQQWASADGAEHGFVVAGPAEQGCRTLSILTRRDGGNQVRSQRECLPPGTTAPAPAATQ